MLLGPQHHQAGCAHSRVGQAEACHEDGPREAAQDPLLECTEVDVAASELQALSQN